MLDEILMQEAIFRVFFCTESNLILFFNLWMFCVTVDEMKKRCWADSLFFLYVENDFDAFP